MGPCLALVAKSNFKANPHENRLAHLWSDSKDRDYAACSYINPPDTLESFVHQPQHTYLKRSTPVYYCDNLASITNATMVKHKGFTAWISVGGKQVVEYATEIEPDGRKATSWIVSQPGKVWPLFIKQSIPLLTREMTRILRSTGSTMDQGCLQLLTLFWMGSRHPEGSYMVTEEACAPALGQAQTPKDHLCLRKYQRMVCSHLIANLTGNSELLMPRSARIKSKNINEKDVGTIVLKIAQVQRGPGRPSESFQVLPPTISRDLAPVTGGHCVTCVEQHHHAVKDMC